MFEKHFDNYNEGMAYVKTLRTEGFCAWLSVSDGWFTVYWKVIEVKYSRELDERFFEFFLQRAGDSDEAIRMIRNLDLTELSLIPLDGFEVVIIRCRRVGILIGHHGEQIKALKEFLKPWSIHLEEDTSDSVADRIIWGACNNE